MELSPGWSEAKLGSGVLTFLAGAEIDHQSLRVNLRASLLIAQKFFQPTIKTMHAWGRLYRRKEAGRTPLETVSN